MEQQQTPAEGEAVSTTDAMGAIWDKYQEDTTDSVAENLANPAEDINDTPEPVEDKEETEAENLADNPAERPRGPDGKFLPKEAAAEPVEAPTHLPRSVREVWDKLDDDARERISSAQGELSEKLAHQGRQLTAITPIYESVQRAAQELPQMKDLTPQQIADDVFELAKIQVQMQQDPIATLKAVADRYGATEGLKAALSGEAAPESAQHVQQLTQTITSLQKQIEQMQDPARVEQIIDQRFNQQSVEQQVDQFKQSHEHYEAVENDLPRFIVAAKAILGDGAPNQDILSRAYDMAVSDRGLKATAKADPERTKAAIKAKSVNVQSRSTGNAPEHTVRDRMGAVWDKYNT